MKKRNYALFTTTLALIFFVFGFALFCGCSGSSDDGGGTPDPTGTATGTGTISGTVYTEFGLPSANCYVSYDYMDSETARQIASTYTDSNGNYTFNNVPSGNIRVSAIAEDGYASHTEVVVYDNQSTTAQMYLQEAGNIQGMVTSNLDGAILSGAKVTAEINNTTVSAYTDEEGYYYMSGIYVGTVALTISKSGYTTQTSSVTVSKGQTSVADFTLIYTGSSPTASPTIAPTVTPTASPTTSPMPGQGKVYALIIGINDYPGGDSDLNYCVNDANSMRSSFESCNLWSATTPTIYYYTNSTAKKSTIISTIESIKSTATANDMFVMTYSGHGSNDGTTSSMVVWNDSGDFDYISADELSTAVNGIACKTAVFLDCCHSGGIIGKSVSYTKNGVTYKARVYTKAPGYDPNFNGRGLETLANSVVVTACKSNQLSYETSALQHGYFTYYFIEGVGDGTTIGPASANGTSITAEETYSYTSPKVSAYSENKQEPQMSDNYADGLIVKQ